MSGRLAIVADEAAEKILARIEQILVAEAVTLGIDLIESNFDAGIYTYNVYLKETKA